MSKRAAIHCFYVGLVPVTLALCGCAPRHAYVEITHHWDNSIGLNDRPAGSGALYNHTDHAVTAPGGWVTSEGRVSFDGSMAADIEADQWELKHLGLSLNYTYTFEGRARTIAPPLSLPPHTFTYLRIQDTYVRHWGTLRRQDAKGLTQDVPFDFMVPRIPGSVIYMGGPYRIDTGEPVTNGSDRGELPVKTVALAGGRVDL